MSVKKPISQLGVSFVDPKYLPKGKSADYLREQNLEKGKVYRNLSAREIESVVNNRHKLPKYFIDRFL